MIRDKIFLFLIDKKGWIPILFLAIFILMILYLPTITTIMILAFFFSYAISPLIEIFSKKVKMPRWFSTAIIMFIISLVILMLIIIVMPVLLTKATMIIKNFPEMMMVVVNWVYEIGEKLGVNLRQHTNFSREMLVERLSSNGTPFMQSLSSFFGMLFKQTFSVLSFIFNLIIFFVISFVVSIRFPSLTHSLEDLFPTRQKNQIMTWINRFDTILSGFIRGQLTVCFVLGAFYALGLTIAGLEDGGSIGAMIGIFCILPYAGIISGFIVASLLALSSSGLILLLKVVIVFLVIQTIDTIFITPNIMGKRVGISPVFVIIALFAGAEAGGFLGVLIAVPLFAIIKLISEDIVHLYKKSKFYTGSSEQL